MATFGSQTTTSSLAISAVNKRGCKFTAPSDLGTVVSISAYCNRTASGSGYAVDAAIYTDNAGAPNALVANSVINLSANIARNAPGWYTGTYGTPPSLTPGNVYWLCQLHTKAGLTYHGAGGTNQQGTNADTLPFDDPFGTPAYANNAVAIYVTYNPPQNRAQVSWAEFEVPNAPRRGRVSWAELEVPGAPRRSFISWGELEVPNAARRALVSWGELELPTAPRRALASWAELELPDAPRRGLITWAEFELPTAPRRGLFSWAELEVPSFVSPDRLVQVSWAELEVPTAPRRVMVSWGELEVPDVILNRSAIISWAELEVPEYVRRSLVSWAELEVPPGPRRARVSWARVEVPHFGGPTEVAPDIIFINGRLAKRVSGNFYILL